MFICLNINFRVKDALPRRRGDGRFSWVSGLIALLSVVIVLMDAALVPSLVVVSSTWPAMDLDVDVDGTNVRWR